MYKNTEKNTEKIFCKFFRIFFCIFFNIQIWSSNNSLIAIFSIFEQEMAQILKQIAEIGCMSFVFEHWKNMGKNTEKITENFTEKNTENFSVLFSVFLYTDVAIATNAG